MKELADAAVYFYRAIEAPEDLKRQHLTADARPALEALRERFAAVEWSRTSISEAIKAIIASHKVKMPRIAMPLRVMVTGTTHTPSIDATLELIGRDEVLARMDRNLNAFPA
jgi:glutamyl-tRNA synthetase